MKRFIGIVNTDINISKLLKMGYNLCINFIHHPNNIYVFIGISDDYYGELVEGSFNSHDDILVDIYDIPKREDFDEYVKMMNNATKMGLL